MISIHALLAESDFCFSVFYFLNLSFLSTLSLRRATARRASRQQPAGISIHALLAESDNINSSVNTADQISIHALLAESDFSTLHNIFELLAISIHALLAESDALIH